MHELSVAQSILDTIQQKLGFVKPLIRVFITIGPLAGVSGESLEFWFSEVAKSQGFGNPEIIIKKPKAVALCAACNEKYELQNFYDVCPKCNSYERTIESGYECMIESIEMEDE